MAFLEHWKSNVNGCCHYGDHFRYVCMYRDLFHGTLMSYTVGSEQRRFNPNTHRVISEKHCITKTNTPKLIAPPPNSHACYAPPQHEWTRPLLLIGYEFILGLGLTLWSEMFFKNRLSQAHTT